MCRISVDTVVGVDAQPGREGGTWFGVSSKFAKIGALLNICEPLIDTRKQPRGHLVTDYLTTDLDAAAFIETIAMQRQKFNLLNLVLLERRFVHFAQLQNSFFKLKIPSFRHTSSEDSMKHQTCD